MKIHMVIGKKENMIQTIIEYVLKREIDLESEEEIREIETTIRSFIYDVEDFLKQEKIPK